MKTDLTFKPVKPGETSRTYVFSPTSAVTISNVVKVCAFAPGVFILETASGERHSVA